jgi:hypothetical protein
MSSHFIPVLAELLQSIQEFTVLFFCPAANSAFKITLTFARRRIVQRAAPASEILIFQNFVTVVTRMFQGT